MAKKQKDELWARIFVHWRTGLRLSELHNSYIKGEYLITYSPIKHGETRSIPIDNNIKICYKIAIAGKYIDDTITKKFKKVIDDLGLYKTQSNQKRSFHTLRHTFACREYLRNNDIYRVKILLGHASVTTTEIYAKFGLELLEQDFPMVEYEN